MSKGDKSKQKTCHAIDACTQDQVIDIFEESFGYLSFVEKFVKRIKSSPIDYNEDSVASSDKPLIILDIDNTILFVRFFSDEICVNDHIIYYHNGIDEISGIVRAVWYRLKLELSDDDLIDEYDTDIIEYDHCHTLTNRLKKKKQFEYPYKINDKTNEIIDSRITLIKELAVIGCEIEYKLPTFNEPFYKYISFEEDSIEIENFLPALKRKGYKDAVFVYDGFIVRTRPGVEDFLDQLDQHWDIVFFTAANRSIYDGLMKQLHLHLCLIMGKEETDEPLWKKIFFRDDCTYDFDERGKIYHHKDLTKYNRDLSKVLIVDNSPLSYKSLEPNSIAIKDFFGKDTIDNELDIVLELTDQIIDIELEYENNNNIYVDHRYILTGIINDAQQFNEIKYNDLNQYDRRNPNDILLSTQRFLHDLKESLMSRGKLPTTLKFGEPRNEDDNMDVIDDSLPMVLPMVDETDYEKDKLHNAQSLHPSSTVEINENEGTAATPKGNYSPTVNIFHENHENHDTSESKDNNNNNEQILDETKDEIEQILEKNTRQREHSYNITINLADIPNFGIQTIDKNDNKSPLGMIMHDPELRDKLADMNEREMRHNIKDNQEFDDLESVSSDNNGIGSKLDDTDDENENEDDDDDSDWDDIDDEDDEKKIDPIYVLPETKSVDNMEDELVDKPQVTRLQAPNINGTGSKKHQRKLSSMKPRPDHEKIASGMSSVFLKRSVGILSQFHEQTARRSSLSRSSIDYHHEEPIIGSNQGVGSLKDKFEKKIAHQTRTVRRNSLRGAEAKEELEIERARRMQRQSTADKGKTFELQIGSPDFNYKTEKPKPKKLIKRIDNPWVAKFKREGIKQPQQLARVMREESKKQPRRKGVINEDNLIVQVQKRALPPSPISKRALPPAPKFNSLTLAKIKSNKNKNNMNKYYSIQQPQQTVNLNKLSFNMDGATMSFSYTPPKIQKQEEKGSVNLKNVTTEVKDKKGDPPSLETIFNKKKGDSHQYIGDNDSDSEDSLLGKMEQAPAPIDE